MSKIIVKLTILFESPFWIGIYEREENKNYEVCKIIFGAEPKDYEIYNFLMNNWNKFQFRLSVKTQKETEKKQNPKRTHREIKKQLQTTGIGTKAQQVLKLQQEQKKLKKKLFKNKKENYKKNLNFNYISKRKKKKRKDIKKRPLL